MSRIEKSVALKTLAALLALAGVFLTASYAAHLYQPELARFVEAGGILGPIAFILFTAVFLIFLIPLDVSVLIPLASQAWGPLPTALMSIVGWGIGSTASLYLARMYGRPFVARLIGAKRVREAAHHAPHENLFWWVVGAQALVQVDFISYMFGLFTRIPIAEYALATAIGDLVPAFYLSYAGALPFWYDVAAVAAGLAVTGLLFWRFTRRGAD